MHRLPELLVLCPPPTAVDRSHRATVAEGVELPSSHRQMLAVYGAGCFDEFLWIYGEGVEREALSIEENTRAARSILSRGLPESLAEHLSGLDITPDQLVQWGGTDNGDLLLWIPTGPVDEWPTLVLEAGRLRFSIVSLESPSMIFELLTKSLKIPIFPPDFPSTNPQFSPDPYR
ncbi:hypothetical protein ACFY1S_22200 [Micromonospora sp. NPDC000663]|uniref:hypothetical protein n=1 Tax=Micromonospora sp. NPDC000663 TaxID=3364218 RepID=UPI00368D3BDD